MLIFLMCCACRIGLVWLATDVFANAGIGCSFDAPRWDSMPFLSRIALSTPMAVAREAFARERSTCFTLGTGRIGLPQVAEGCVSG